MAHYSWNFWFNFERITKKRFSSYWAYVVPVPSYSRKCFSWKSLFPPTALGVFRETTSPRVEIYWKTPKMHFLAQNWIDCMVHNKRVPRGAVWAVRVPEKVRRLAQKNYAKGSTLPLCCDATPRAIWMKLGWSSDPDEVIKCTKFCFDRFNVLCFARYPKSVLPILSTHRPQQCKAILRLYTWSRNKLRSHFLKRMFTRSYMKWMELKDETVLHEYKHTTWNKLEIITRRFVVEKQEMAAKHLANPQNSGITWTYST